MASQSQKERSGCQERYKRSSSPEQHRSPREPGKPLGRGRRYEWRSLARGHPAVGGDARWKAVRGSSGLGHRACERRVSGGGPLLLVDAAGQRWRQGRAPGGTLHRSCPLGPWGLACRTVTSSTATDS